MCFFGAFRINDEFVSQGRLGMAILSDSSDDSHQIILYKSKENILSIIMLSKAIVFQANHPLLRYCDDAGVCWSLGFNQIDDLNEVIEHLQQKCSVTVELKKDPQIETDADKSETDSNISNKDLMNRMAKIGQPLPTFNKGGNVNDDIESSWTSKTSHSSFSESNLKTAPTATPRDKTKQVPFDRKVSDCDESSDSVVTIGNVAELEARIHNTELRMNLLKLDTKMDRVLDNIERLQLSTSKHDAGDDEKENEIIKLEERVLQLKKENRLLKLQANKNEQSDKANDNVNENMLKLHKTIEEKDLEMSALKLKIKDLEADLLESKLAKSKAVEEIERKMADELEILGRDIKEKENLLAKASSEAGESQNNNGLIMGIMNKLYQELYINIDGKFANSVDLLKLIAKIIRKQTEAALN